MAGDRTSEEDDFLRLVHSEADHRGEAECQYQDYPEQTGLVSGHRRCHECGWFLAGHKTKPSARQKTTPVHSTADSGTVRIPRSASNRAPSPNGKVSLRATWPYWKPSTAAAVTQDKS